MAKTTTTNPAAEALEALRRLDATPEATTTGTAAVLDASIEQRAVAGALRERDHLEGCPAYGTAAAYTRVEVFAAPAPAPSPPLAERGVTAGGRVVVVNCQECGGRRYFAEHRDVRGFMRARLTELAGLDAAATAPLDSTL